jgi:hypothetical protein
MGAFAAGAGCVFDLYPASAQSFRRKSVDIASFDGKTPRFELEKFFSGNLEGWGYTVSRFNALQNQFKITAKGEWNAASNSLTLKETYTFDDGHTDVLNWTIIKQSNSTYEGREDRIEGAAKGQQAGNAFHWTYKREVPDRNGKTSTVGFDDWFWLQQPDVMLAHASLTKLGIEVARLSAFYRKV